MARYGDTVLFVDDDGPSAAELLAAIESAANTPHPGAAIAERLAPLAVGHGSTHVPAFGVVAPMPEGLLVILRGSVEASITTPEGVRALSGQRAYTWVDEVLPETVTQVGVAAAEASKTLPSPHTDLRAGVVPAGGFVLDRTRGAGERPSHPKRPAETPQRRAQPDAGEPTLERPFPSSEASTDSVAGSVLVADDGAIYPLDRPYVLGRDPRADDAVRSAAASPIEVHNDRHVSRVHAYISIDDDMVRVRDASTPAGTFVAAPGAKEWTQVGTAPTELPVGSSLRIGERIFTHAGR